MGGYIMQLQDFSVNDGEGIRTNLFLAGCPLRCAWCANPEGQTLENAMTRYVETEEILEQIERQRIFYRSSGGGITFTGGEATMQEAFLRELTGEFYDRGISMALETCGYFTFENVRDILEKMDLIFYDLKHMDAGKHREFTGVSNEKILENAGRTAGLGIPMVVRIPAIHGVNTDERNLRAACDFMREHMPGAKLEFLPYHRFGEEKYRQLGLSLPPAEFATPPSEEIADWRRKAKEWGVPTVSYR